MIGSPHVCDALALPPGSAVIRRQRVTYRGETPVSASVTWLDGALAEAAPRLLATERIIAGTAGYIAQMTGREAVSGIDQDSARPLVHAPLYIRLTWGYSIWN